jgi:hypothetical protein
LEERSNLHKIWGRNQSLKLVEELRSRIAFEVVVAEMDSHKWPGFKSL